MCFLWFPNSTREVSFVPSIRQQVGKILSYAVQNQLAKKKKLKGGRAEEKTKDTALYYTLPNYLYAFIINRENFTLFSYKNFKFRQKIKCYK